METRYRALRWEDEPEAVDRPIVRCKGRLDPEDLEFLILEHQHRIDQARNQGKLCRREEFGKPDHIHGSWLPGWEYTARGQKLGRDSRIDEYR